MRVGLRNFSQTGNGVGRADGTGIVAGHPSLSIGTRILVTNTTNGQKLEVTIADRIRASQDRIIELSKAAADRLGISRRAAPVRIESVDRR
jgi:rare lipoprotein A